MFPGGATRQPKKCPQRSKGGNPALSLGLNLMFVPTPLKLSTQTQEHSSTAPIPGSPPPFKTLGNVSATDRALVQATEMLYCFCFETRSCYMAKTGLKIIILPQPPKFWDDKSVPPCVAEI